MLVMMTTWIVLLRGVNVGGRNRLPMAALRELLAEVGFENVRTYIQSGNIVVDSADGDRDSVARSVQGAIEGRFGFAPHTFVLDVDAFDAAIAANPFSRGDEDPKAVHFFFLAEPDPAADLDGLRELGHTRRGVRADRGGLLPPHPQRVRPVQAGRAIAPLHRGRDDGPQPPVGERPSGHSSDLSLLTGRPPAGHSTAVHKDGSRRACHTPARRVRIMTDRSPGPGSGSHLTAGPSLAGEALGCCGRLTGDPEAEFRPNQLETIERLVGRRERVLLVQRTGWGKSAVYFIATRMLRNRGNGPTLLVSPLLALMRNQIEAARRMDVQAETINSANRDDWPRVLDGLDRGTVDLLLISPERLANPEFRSEVPAQGREPERSAGGRRGALHLGLGPRLPPGLPADHPRSGASACRCPRAVLHSDSERSRRQ